MGKGSKPRPIADIETFSSNWDAIFNKKLGAAAPKTYMVDIDGTICSNTHGDYEAAVPLLENIAKVNRLYDQGNKIIYWTARGATTGLDWSALTESQVTNWGCKYHELRMGKPAYDVWVDDKAINAKDFFK